jgi:hypothetical protein
MRELIYYNNSALEKEDISKFPGMDKFLYFFKIYSVQPIFDRTGTIKLPILAKSLYPIPKFRIFTKTFEEVCNNRAKDILENAEKSKKRLYVFYSGGIDSTLVVVSLLKNANESQKNNLIILLSEHSIKENVKFYNDYIGGRLKVEPSRNFPYLLGQDSLFVSGEHNDHLFGSVWVKELMEIYGDDIIHKPYDLETIIDFFSKKEKNLEYNTFWANLLHKIVLNAPIKIETFFDFFWWVAFSIRFQGFVMYPLLSANLINMEKINEEYFKNNYLTFYGTDDFQLWSMNNMDKKIKDTWKSFKWICKEIIYNFNHDAEYKENKIKIASMRHIIPSTHGRNFLDAKFRLYDSLPLSEIYNEDNDFK